MRKQVSTHTKQMSSKCAYCYENHDETQYIYHYESFCCEECMTEYEERRNQERWAQDEEEDEEEEEVEVEVEVEEEVKEPVEDIMARLRKIVNRV